MSAGALADDLALIIAAARACGPLLRERFNTEVQTWTKTGGSPVTEIDLTLDAMLTERLRGARPGYGWLSEETTDNPDRLSSAHAFVVDPLDGTRAFLAGKPEFCISIAIVAHGQATAGAIYNPVTEEMFEGGAGLGARLNGQAVSASSAAGLPGAVLFAAKRWFDAPGDGAPRFAMKSALAYRIALVAAGHADGMASMGLKHEWDVAAGAAIVEAAGGVISDFRGAPLCFNQADPRLPGVVAAGAGLHPLLVERTRTTPDPRPKPEHRA